MASSMFATMNQHVAASRETLFADIALIGPFTGVHAFVLLHQVIPREYLVANITLICILYLLFLPVNHTLVSEQKFLLRESFTAILAEEHFSVQMTELVIIEMVIPYKALAAHFTIIIILALMHSL